VIALLRYAWLKSVRDSSLMAFVLVPMFAPAAALCGATLGKGWHYPMFMEVRYTPQQNAELAVTLGMAGAMFFAAIAAFWIFRPELATHSIGSLAIAARPFRLVAVPALYGGLIGILAFIGSVGIVCLLTAAVPSHLASMALRLIAATLAAGAAGVMAVTISAQPPMIIGACLASAALTPVIDKPASWLQIPVAIAAIAICISIAAFLMERRCAS